MFRESDFCHVFALNSIKVHSLGAELPTLSILAFIRLFIVCHLKIALSCFSQVFCLFIEQVIHRLPVPFCGDELHHSGWNACSRLVNYED